MCVDMIKSQVVEYSSDVLILDITGLVSGDGCLFNGRREYSGHDTTPVKSTLSPIKENSGHECVSLSTRERECGLPRHRNNYND